MIIPIVIIHVNLFFYSVRDEKSYVLNDIYYELNHENLEAFISHLKKIGGKPLKSKCKKQNIFKLSLSLDERGIKLLARCHIQCALEYVEFIKKNIDKKKLKIIVAEIIPYVKRLFPNEYTSFILISTNILPSAVHFDNAKILFYSHDIRKQFQDNYSVDLLVIYGIRLSLESRIKRLLGIDYVITSKKHNIGLSQFIEISKMLKHVEYAKEIDWEEIDWIVKWLNHFIHRLIRPYPWVIHQCIVILENFVSPRSILTTSNKKILSFYSATVVLNEEKLKNEIERHLKKIDEEIIIRWTDYREILKL